MSNIPNVKTTPTLGGGSGLFKKEDYWAVWIGLGTVILAIILWAAGSKVMPSLAISFPAWDNFGKVSAYLGTHLGGIIGLWFCFLVVFSVAVKILGHDLKAFVPGFTILFILGVLVSILGASTTAKKWSLEAPLMALLVGLIIGNFVPIPKWLDTAFRTEFYVKTGIVLMGATLPFTLILQSGPMAFLQATIVAVSTFLTIYWAGTRLFGLDKRFSTALAAGGSICGVSAAIAIGGSVKAEKNHVSVAISLVVVWAVIMVFLLPILIKVLHIAPGPGGAWIGTSEFADAAGIAAAASINEQAIKTFTLMKVVGRDMFVGIWCFIMAMISVTKWEKRDDGTKPSGKEIWVRFPKFVLGFFAASIIVTLLLAFVDAPTAKSVKASIIAPISMIRLWAFIFTFLCIGLTTRFKDLAAVGWRPFAAFTTGVLVNVPLGYILSVIVLGGYWEMVK
ncbi:MAG: putative sulfate exporter family transporter [Desulfitobacteriaceae bacterium]|nr:putative sulfate exporter family transporter [Desulfitobacteriaceae bacterium]MDI6878699.1 putative sulfate exporter family transporter [Desulfitobacteriaceae bacterium]MDI6914118.1 putative sulfate exporter family transporter [Desulfitobacteriaceae bacterium]